MASTPRQRWIALLLALALVLVFQLDGGFQPGNDAKPNVYGAATLLAEGRLAFEPQREPFMFTWEVDGPQGIRLGSLVSWTSPIDGRSPAELHANGSLRLRAPKYFIVKTEASDRYVSAFGPAPALVSLPVFAVLHATVGDLREHPKSLWYGGKVAASILVASAAAFIFLIAVRLEIESRYAIAIALTYALATCAWSVLSQTLWQQSVDSFFLALAAFLLVRALALDSDAKSARRARSFVACGLAFGAAAACRPTSFVVLAVVAGFIVARRRLDAPAFLAAACVPATGILGYNAVELGSPFSFGQILSIEGTGRSAWTFPAEGLAGLAVSPGRGLLFFSPVIFFALWGHVRAWRTRDEPRWAALRVLSCAAAAAMLVEASHFEWWGGWTYGYRRIADTMPFLVLGLIPLVHDLARRSAYRIAFVATFLWSAGVQALGAMAYDLDGWNARRVDGVAQDIDRPEYRHRLWSIADSPIVYYATHFDAARKHREEWIQTWLRRPSA